MYSILVNGIDVTSSTIWHETSFESRAAADPGTASISLIGAQSFLEGSRVEFLDPGGNRLWFGYSMQTEKTYIFPDSPQPKTILHCVDLNVLFDKLVLYNKAHPELYPDGGGKYKKSTSGPIAIRSASGGPERDVDYILAMLKDTDIDRVLPKITTKLTEVGYLNTTATKMYINGKLEDVEWTPPSSGTTLRGLMTDVARNVKRSQPGSMVWYINPDAQLVYQAVDDPNNIAPFSVGDGGGGVSARGLSITVDASHLKNNVLMFSNKVDQRLDNQQEYLYYIQNEYTKSVQGYGLHQYSEVVDGWSKEFLRARATKVPAQEGGPAVVARFTVFEPGLFPGQLITISSGQHTYTWFDTGAGVPLGGSSVPSGEFITRSDVALPIREVRTSFVTKDQPVFNVTCSIDTQDPWGLQLAVRRQPTRGFVAPTYEQLNLQPGETPLPTPWYTIITEFPQKISGNDYQCSYAYLGLSLEVWVGGAFQSMLDENGIPQVGSADGGFKETSPVFGRFRLGTTPPAGSRVYVRYTKTYDLKVQT